MAKRNDDAKLLAKVQSESEPTRGYQIMHEIMAGGFVRSIMAILAAFVIAIVLVIVTNEDVLNTAGYFFTQPMDTINAVFRIVGDFFYGMFRGAIYNPEADSFAKGIQPLTETLRFSGPLIAAGLGIALSFRVGLFNIGGQGQILVGASFAGWVSFQVEMPFPIHLIVAIIAGLIGAAIWAGIVGWLRAYTGAHEVIVTIMMNYIALYLVTFFMRTSILNPGATTTNPATKPPHPTAQMPLILGDTYLLHMGFLLALVSVAVYWWLMERSALGFRFRAVGYNPLASETAGINPKKIFIIAMIASGAFVGVAAAGLALGRTGGFSPSVHGGIGFDAITVALLGQNSAPGVLFAGLLFGAMEAAGPSMQRVGVSPDILGVVQGLIVLFVAAPPLVRAMFRLPKPNPSFAGFRGGKPSAMAAVSEATPLVDTEKPLEAAEEGNK
jgi:ABC-type uncharacterized transport system permease subunit